MGLFKKAKKLFKKVAKVAAPIAGAAIGGPAGAAIGGAVGGVASGGGLKGALLGAGLSYAGATVAGNLLTSTPTALGNAAGGINFANVPSGAGVVLGSGSVGAAGVQISQSAFDTALASSTGFWGALSNSTSNILNTASNVIKTVQAVNSATGATMRIGVNDAIPQGWTVDSGQAPLNIEVPTVQQSPNGAELPAGFEASAPQTSHGVPVLLLVGVGAFLLWKSKK